MKNKLWGLLIGLVLTVFFTLPLLKNFSSHLNSRQDGVLISWLIDWGSNSLLKGENFFNAPLFHPEQNTIAYSDQFFSTALLNIPLVIIEDNFLNREDNLANLIINHNLHLFLGSIFVFWGQYLLVLFLTKNKQSAIVSGLIFAFSSMHFQYIVHLQSFLIAGIPFYFLFLFKYLKTTQTKYLPLLSLALLYQLLNSPMSGLFLIVLSLVILFYQDYRKVILQNIRVIFPYILGITIIVSFFYFPYLQVSREFNYTRSIRDTAHFSLSIDKLISSEILFYSGLIYLLLKLRNKNKKLDKKFWLFLAFTILGGLLMLGPVLKVNDQTLKIFNLPIPLPYTLFYYLFPGFKAFRDSSRWIVVFCFGLSVVIGYLLDNLNVKNKKNIIHITTASLFILLWTTQVPQTEMNQISSEIPPIYDVIKNRPEKVLAEFPTYVWSQTDSYYLEADRLLFQSYHNKKLYNGYSGFIPPHRENLWHTITNSLAKKETIQHLKDSGVELVLLNSKQNKTLTNFSSKNYQLVTCRNQLCLYTLK